MKTRIITFNIEQFSEIKSAVDSYIENIDFSVIETKNLDDLTEVLGHSEATILLFSIHTKEKLQGLVGIFKKYIKAIKAGRIKLAYVQISKNQKIENILQKFSCNDILDSNILTKSLKYKIDIWSRNVVTNTQKLEKLKEDTSLEKKKILQDKNRRSYTVNQLDPLDGEFDIWLSPKNNCKAILAKWLVSLYGPSPHVSKWEAERPGVWRYVLESDIKEKFQKTKGNWFFEGLKPEFNWKERHWNFSSSDFNLYFVDSKGSVHTKIKWNFTDLDIKSNSIYANSLLPKIVETVSDKVNVDTFKKNESSDKKKELKGSRIQKEYLEAETKTDKLNSHLLGESNSNENTDGTYSGKLKEHTLKEPSDFGFKENAKNEKDLSGKGSSVDQFSNLSGEINTDTENTKDSKDSDLNSKEESTKTSQNRKSKESNAIKETNDTLGVDKKNKEEQENKKNEMLDAMVNPSKKAVRISNGSIAYLCDLVDFFEEELYVTINGNELEKGTKYSVVITMDMGKSKVSITTEGVVDSIDNEIYKILVTKVPNSEYEKFMTCFEERQDEVNDFIQKARGF